MLFSQTTGQGQNVVLLHGWGFNSNFFDDFINQYQSRYRITKIDLPGHGRSDEVFGGLKQWCNEIIKVLPNEPILIGWSLGGLLAIHIATKIRLSKLILVASTPNFVQNSDWDFGIDADNFRQFSDTLQLNLSKSLKRFIHLQTQDKAQIRKLSQLIDAFPATTTALNQGLDILLNTDLVDALVALKTPVEVILGGCDTLVPNNIHTWYQQHNIKVTILDTGHLPFLHPDFAPF